MAFNNVHEFEINVVGAITETPWVGKFKSKIHLGTSEELAYAKRKKDMLPVGHVVVPGDDLAMELDNKAEALSMVQTRLVQWPAWWTEMRQGADMIDHNVLYSVYNSVMEPWIKDMEARRAKALKQAPELRADQDKKDGLV